MEGRKIERMFRSFGFAGEDSEESVATEYEDSFVRHVADSQLFDYSSASGSSTPHSSRSIDYRTKDLALHRIEEICKSFHAEDASSIESDTSFSLAPRRLNTSCQMSSEYSYDSTQAVFPTNILNISTASASNDHDGTESLSSSFEMVDNFLNKRINDSTSMALDYVDTIGCKNNPHNTWQNHQDSFKFTESASYMAIQAVLHKLRKIPNKKEDCGATAEWNQCFNRLSKSFQTVTNDFKQQLSTILEETQLGDDDNSISVFREIVMKIIGKTCDIQDDIQSLISFVNDYMLPNVSSVRFPSLSAAEVDVKAASPVATNPVNIAKCKKIYRKTPVDLAKGLTFANTPLRIAELTRGIDTPKSNTQCPSGTPGSPGIPMPELIEEQEKLLAECHMKELAVASESSYSLKSVNNCKSTNFDDSNHQSNELSPINSAARGQVSDNFYDSLGDLDIEEKMVERDKQIAETEKTIKGTVDNKKITGSYSDESLNIVNTNFDNSGSRVKSGDGLHDSGVETTSSACRSRRNKFSGSDNSLESRLDNISIPTAASSTSKVDSTKKTTQINLHLQNQCLPPNCLPLCQ